MCIYHRDINDDLSPGLLDEIMELVVQVLASRLNSLWTGETADWVVCRLLYSLLHKMRSLRNAEEEEEAPIFPLTFSSGQTLHFIFSRLFRNVSLEVLEMGLSTAEALDIFVIVVDNLKDMCRPAAGSRAFPRRRSNKVTVSEERRVGCERASARLRLNSHIQMFIDELKQIMKSKRAMCHVYLAQGYLRGGGGGGGDEAEGAGEREKGA